MFRHAELNQDFTVKSVCAGVRRQQVAHSRLRGSLAASDIGERSLSLADAGLRGWRQGYTEHGFAEEQAMTAGRVGQVASIAAALSAKFAS